MPPEERDRALLWDMRQAAEKITNLVLDTPEADFPDNELVRFAVERLVLVLGEAAARVSEPYRLQHPEIAWSRMQRTRNLVAHNYGKPMAGELYRTCRRDVLPLSRLLATLVSAPPEGEEGRAL